MSLLYEIIEVSQELSLMTKVKQFQVTGGTSAQSQGGGQHQVPPALKNFSISQKEKTLGELVKDQWLCSTPNGTVGLGVRSFLDLRSWFHNNDVPSCEVCNEGAVKVMIFSRPLI